MIELSENISDYIKNTFGLEFLEKYQNFQQSKYPAILRLSGKTDEQEYTLKSLSNQGIELKRIKDVPNAFLVVEGEDKIGKTVEHTIGKYYIQSLSSMIPPLVLKPSPDDVVLDLCAAPGSKSTQLAELMEYEGTLISNEPNLNRIKALIHNLDKMNALNIRVVKEKGELLSKRFPEYFDKILVDAPCSALGVIQKKQEVSNWWSANSVDKISSLQLKLLVSAIKMARVGAEIIYSTCTLTVEENEYIVNKVLEKYPVELMDFDLPLPHIDGFVKIADYKFNESLKLTKRIIPWELKSEGFFVAKLVKKDSTAKEHKNYPVVQNKKRIVLSDSKFIKKYLSQISDHFGIDAKIFTKYKFLINNKDVNFTNADSDDYDPDYFLRVGTKFGIIDKHDQIKLNSHAAQIIGKLATKNIFELQDEEELKIYFSGGNINRYYIENGQKIIKFGASFLGTGIASKSQLKSQFPRSKRTGTILI